MDRHLIDYLPPVLKKVREFQAINEANEPEFTLAWAAVQLLLDNQFLETATEVGVSVWEKELGIYPKDTDTLELRKMRIKAMWGLHPPYTITWLRNWMTRLCGEAGHSEWVEDYRINVQLNYSVIEHAQDLATEILNLLLCVRPENMLLQMTTEIETTGTVAYGIRSELAGRIEVWPLLITEMESVGTVVAGGGQEYRTKIEIYPLGGMGNG